MPSGSIASETKTLKVGDMAPDFTLPTAKGTSDKDKITLSDFRGKKNVVLVFYPFAFTPVWTAQMPAYNADLAKFEGYDAQVLGVSIDSVHTNSAWAKSLGGLDYPLLSDFWPHGAVAEKYGVLRPEGQAERAIFIIDKEGKIVYIDVHDISKQPDNEDLFEVLRQL